MTQRIARHGTSNWRRYCEVLTMTPCINMKVCAPSNRYPTVRRNGKMWKAHRYIWSTTKGAIPPKMFVLHKCDNPACVNPDHLFLGTQADNVRDMRAKGRERHPHGEDHPLAKLTAKDVLAIRGSRLRHAALAKIFSVTSTNIRNIRRRKIWRHV